MAAGSRIAVVVDDADLRGLILEYLRLHGFSVRGFADPAGLEAGLREGGFDLVILGLPPDSVLPVTRYLRGLPQRPAIMLAAAPGHMRDPAALPHVGADDWIARPFGLRDLLARMRSLLRRRAGTASPAAARSVSGADGDGFRPVPAPADRISFAGLTLCRDERRLLDGSQAEVPLTPMEIDLLLLLAAHPAEVLSRERLLVMAHGKDVDPLDRSIDIRITRLRRKIEPDPANPRLIRTIRGQGYVFTPEDA